MLGPTKTNYLVKEILAFRVGVKALSTTHAFERPQTYKTTDEALEIIKAIHQKFRSKTLKIVITPTTLLITIPL